MRHVVEQGAPIAFEDKADVPPLRLLDSLGLVAVQVRVIPKKVIDNSEDWKSNTKEFKVSEVWSPGCVEIIARDGESYLIDILEHQEETFAVGNILTLRKRRYAEGWDWALLAVPEPEFPHVASFDTAQKAWGEEGAYGKDRDTVESTGRCKRPN